LDSIARDILLAPPIMNSAHQLYINTTISLSQSVVCLSARTQFIISYCLISDCCYSISYRVPLTDNYVR